MKKFSWFFIIFFSFLVFHSYLKVGMPYTHDGENHLARFANYKIALKEGQLPPRWAPNLMNHYGYPVFNYNYPLANLLSLPFSALKISYEVTFKGIAVFFLIFGGWGIYRWNTLANKSKLLQFLTLGSYYASFYLINLLLYRGSIGEVMAYGLLPWLFWGADLLKSKVSISKLIQLVVLWTLMALAHNISLLMAVGGVTVWLVINRQDLKSLGHIFVRQTMVWLLAALLSAWFWLPAIVELNLVSAGHSHIVQQAADHLLTIFQLTDYNLNFGYSLAGRVDSLSLGLGSVQVMIILFSILAIIKFKKARKQLTCLTIFALFLVWIETYHSSFLWSYFKPLLVWQFPWRWQLLLSVILTSMMVRLWNFLGSKLKFLMLLVLIFQLTLIFQAEPTAYFHKNNAQYDAFPQSTSTNNENMPFAFRYLNFGDYQPAPSILSGKGQIKVDNWSGSQRSYQLTLSEDSIITEPTIRFLGWRTRVKNEKTGQEQIVNYLENDKIQGRIAYQLPTGQYLVATRFYQLSWPRRLGNALFVLTAGLLIFLQIKFAKSYV